MQSGWYPDPSGLPFERYWDGVRWSESVRPSNSTSSDIPATAKRSKGRSPKTIGLAVVAGLIVVGAVGSSLSKHHDKKQNAADSASYSASEPIAAPPVTSASAAHKAVMVASSASKQKAPKVRPTKAKLAHRRTQPPAVDDGSFTMPNEVGQVLQDAQDDIQRVSGDPVFFTHSHDLLGDRFQVLDSDWTVCSQNVSPGSTVSAIGHIDFGVVKSYESCP